MAFLLGRRRLVGMRMETTSGTAFAPNMSNDNIPLLRSAQMTVEPISVERPTLRLTQTPIGDIYPGKSLGTIEFTFELSANGTFTGDSSSAERSPLTRPLQASMYAMQDGVTTYNIHGYKVTGVTTNNGPLRHTERLSGTGVTLGTGGPPTPSGGGPNGWRAVGDCYADDGQLFVAEGTANGPLTGGSFTGEDSGSVFTVTTRGSAVFAWVNFSEFQSLINASVANATVDLYDDGKRYRLKGCVGNCEFQFRHGDAVLVKTTMRGVVDSYIDTALPSTPFESHKFPPTFLGSRVTLRRPINVPATAEKYGTGGGAGGAITGALNSMTLRTGNEIVLHENSMDPNGVNYAIITGRTPEGEFNPDEVLESEFSFQTYFFAGKPVRLRVTAVGPDATSYVFDDPSTANQNIFAFLVPGAVITGLGDTSRDGLNAWDGRFKMTGGNYTATVAQSETPGQDNEFTILHY